MTTTLPVAPRLPLSIDKTNKKIKLRKLHFNKGNSSKVLTSTKHYITVTLRKAVTLRSVSK
jgi:hypothetical protein